MDEVLPVSGGGINDWSGLGITLVDSLDTLWLMGMKEEFYEAMEWVKNGLNFDQNKYVSVFETTIRCLGGLLSAFDLSGEDIFLEKAQDLGDRLFQSFSSPSGAAFAAVNLQTGATKNEDWLAHGGYEVNLAGSTTLPVEFRYLAKATGKREYATKAEKVFKDLKKIEPEDGLYPGTMNIAEPLSLGYALPQISFGAFGDSFYEYLLKIWLQGNKSEPMYREMYDKSIQGMHDRLLREDSTSGLWYIGQIRGGFDSTMEHLVCFMGGLLALGAYTDPNGLQSERAQRDLKTGKALTYSCYQMYASTKTGLSPDSVNTWNPSAASRRDVEYKLRPETVESFFVLHQLTGDPIYREWGWEVFQSIEKYCKTQYAYGSYRDVNNPSHKQNDKMESIFLGETLKYLYLLFDSDTEMNVLEKVCV